MKFVSPMTLGPTAKHLLIGLACAMPITWALAQGAPDAPVVAPPAAKAQPLSVAQIDALVEKTMKAFDVPGISVALVKDGKILLAKGYGVRSIQSGQKMDAHTRVGIASNSKAFTAAALAILVDAGKLKWDDRVTDYIPEFKLYSPYVTEEFTVRDLLTHRSGLGLGAGDLMFFPYGSDFTTKDVIHNLRHLKQVSSFRSKYDYDNNLYIVAGEVVKRVSGIAFEQFVEQKILSPLAMNDSAASLGRLKSKDNIVTPHVSVEGRLQVMADSPSDIINAAGGLYSSANDMAKWVTMLLAKGKYGPTGERLLSEESIKQMWSPQTILQVGGPGS
jgi:CubicO group peptidase (beta-lactamase class C family)